MGAFLIDANKICTYADLLTAIIQDDSYVPLLKTQDLFTYFVNLVKALANGVPLTLLDSDLNPTELSGIDAKEVNVSRKLDIRSFKSMEEVMSAVRGSCSHITIFTSGTTGQPKRVEHSISTLTRSVRIGERYKGLVWAYAYNPTHMAGLQVFFQAFENLNTLVNVFNHSRKEVYECIERHAITHISATPTFYRLLLPFEKEYKTVQRVTLGGEKSDGHLYDSIHRIFPCAKINNVYASTEAGSLFASQGDVFRIPDSIINKFRVEGDELLIHRSLLGQSDSFDFDGDYYHSGDLIEWIDRSKGTFRFKSRKNELINVGGYKVNPSEVEAAINGLDGVRQSRVYGRPNSVLGNILCAEVQLEENASLTDLDIRRYLQLRLQDFKIPRRIRFVDSFSLTRTGKLKRT